MTISLHVAYKSWYRDRLTNRSYRTMGNNYILSVKNVSGQGQMRNPSTHFPPTIVRISLNCSLKYFEDSIQLTLWSLLPGYSYSPILNQMPLLCILREPYAPCIETIVIRHFYLYKMYYTGWNYLLPYYRVTSWKWGRISY